VRSFHSKNLFERVDIRDAASVQDLFDRYQPDGVVKLAAETNEDSSVFSPKVKHN
jgi:dTDP-glucose 4,6-dehydratase